MNARVIGRASAGVSLAVLGLLTAAMPASAAHVQRSGHVLAAVHHDTSAPLRNMRAAAPRFARSGALPLRRLPGHRGHGRQSGALQLAPGSLLAPTNLANFAGIGNGFSGPEGSFTVQSAPPDPNAAVGPNHIVETVNTDLAVFNKSGTVLYGPVAINTLWTGFGGGCQTNNDGDATVSYDRIADRWVIQQFSVSTTPYLDCVAVSQTPDPTGAWNRYSFSYGNTDFPDYPKLAVWPDAYYVTYNIFANGSTFSGARACALDRAAMLAGQAATQQCFDTSTSYGGILPSDLDGHAQPPAGSPDYLVGLGTTATTLAYWKFHVDWATPANSTFTGPTALAVAAYDEACGGGTCIPQSGTTQQLDSLADRLMYRLAYRNFGDHEALVVDHSVTAGSGTGIRWYELRPDASHNLTVFQQGTYAPDSSYRWMGSIAMDQAGDMGLGFSVSSSSLHPEIHYTGRLAGDALGTMTQGEGTIINGNGSQTGSSLSRWGDYSSMSVDPSDDCTFWYTQEYIPADGAFNWSTRLGSFKLPGCGSSTTNDFSISASPPSVSLAQGASGSSTILTTVTSGSAETVNLNVSGVPSGASASLVPTSLATGGSSTLTINTGTAAPGTYTLTVTGTAASATHATDVSLTIQAPNDFSIAASPPSLSLVQTAIGTSTISTAVTSGPAETVNLSVSGVPSGATASLAPPSVTAGGSSTLTINAGSAAAGSYTLTLTGAAASATHTASIGLTVTALPSLLVNGGFETGNLTGWTSTGSANVVTSGCHGGTFCARVGSPSPTNGDSSIRQTFTTPAGSNPILSLWYNVTCPDTLTYDWATATVTDSTAGTTTTVLPKTCSNSGAWAQVSTVLAGGHTYTLTLTSHDDNYPGDATYTRYDDVVENASTPPPTPFVNGGFETGGLTGWTKAGSANVITSGCHGGTYCARVGSPSPTNGDSSITQTFTAAQGGSSLLFYYRVVCPDTLTYDWATATLKDNASGSTATVLPKTCTNTGSWAQVLTPLTGGRTYTLTLTSHDDNYPGDATYTVYDDVSIQ
jgi:hypothetical protein